MKSVLLFILLLSLSIKSFSQDIDFRSKTHITPSDYLFGSHGKRKDPVFDTYRTIDLSVDFGIGSDCGKLSVKNTLQAALKNILDTKYLGNIGTSLIAASPLLFASYMSPTWAAILKHSRVRADFLAQLRLNQCKAIDKFIDGRVEDFYKERAKCTRQNLNGNLENLDGVVNSCSNHWSRSLADWSGKNGQTIENRLIESTAKWAGFTGKSAKRVVDITKALIGDTVVKRGSISIDYGPHRIPKTPRTHLIKLKNDTFDTLCNHVLRKVIENGGFKANIYRIISEQDLKEISGSDGDSLLIDRQTLLSLSYLPFRKRQIACKKLADTIATNVFANDMGQALDFISSKMSNSPHLPEKQKSEVERKRRVLKDQVEMTLKFETQNTGPLNDVLYQINREGDQYRDIFTERELDLDKNSVLEKKINSEFFDCSDNVFCSDF